MNGEADRYYTPDAVAARLAKAITLPHLGGVVDSNCGDGGLLRAVASRYPNASCLGIDTDARALTRLSRHRPDWSLVIGDSLEQDAWAIYPEFQADVAILNPPFSMVTSRGVTTTFAERSFRTGTAMAHVLAVIKNTRPKEIAAIVPESWAYSELDRDARIELSRLYDCQVLECLTNSTFLGARANALLVRLRRGRARIGLAQANTDKGSGAYRLVRGGLPVFEAVSHRRGVPYVHSTDLAAFDFCRLRRVRPISRGTLSGEAILFPRVGRPSERAVRRVLLDEPVQLSDCVMAIQAKSSDALRKLEEEVHRQWSDFQALFSGTGARFTTVARVCDWLRRIGFPT